MWSLTAGWVTPRKSRTSLAQMPSSVRNFSASGPQKNSRIASPT